MNKAGMLKHEFFYHKVVQRIIYDFINKVKEERIKCEEVSNKLNSASVVEESSRYMQFHLDSRIVQFLERKFPLVIKGKRER